MATVPKLRERFSRAIRVGDRVLISGTGPVWPSGDCDPDPGAQARRCFELMTARAEAFAQLISLESTVGDEQDAVLADFVVDENLPDMDEIAARIVLKGQVEGVLETLTPRERRVVELRFGLEGDKLYTLSEIGAELGVTRERIRQIETKALRKLRHPSRSKRLREFTD